MQGTARKVITRIYGHGRGWAFSPKDFLDIGSRSSIDKALSVLRRKGTIRRVCRGIYDYPRSSKALNMEAPPDLNQVAHAIARSRGWTIQASGLWAANLLGVSTQVPAHAVYLSDGPRMSCEIGGRKIEFKPVAPKDLDAGKCGLVIQALRACGKNGIDDKTIAYLRRNLSQKDCRKLLAKRHVTTWVYEIIKQICCRRED